MQPIEHVKALCEIGPRPPTSDAEARAAAYARARLEAAGARDVSVEPFRNVAAGWKAFEIPLVIGIAATGADYFGGRVCSALLCVLSLYFMVAESGFWKYSLTNFLPKRTSQNVYGTIPPKGKPSRKLVVIGHLDTALTPILFHPAIVPYFKLILMTPAVCIALKMLIFLFGSVVFSGAGALTAAILLDIPVAVVLLVVLHGDFFTPFTEGANDNATGAAVALSLAEHLAREPLERTEYWALCTGCEEAMLGGIQAFLDRHAEDLKDASFVNLECLGKGTLRYITYEGMLKKYHSDPGLIRALSETSDGDIKPLPLKFGDTENLMIRRRGLKGITIMAFPEGSALVPHWHRLSDRVENINPQNLERTVRHLIALARKLDS
jgi:hypothetical protein